MQKAHGKSAEMDNDYEIVFDHLQPHHEDSHPSYDLEEQPTVVYVDDMGQESL